MQATIAGIWAAPHPQHIASALTRDFFASSQSCWETVRARHPTSRPCEPGPPALLGLAPLQRGRHALWVMGAGPESRARPATQDSKSCRGKRGCSPQACRIVIPFTQVRGPCRLGDESNSPGEGT